MQALGGEIEGVESDEESEQFELGTAALIFGSVSAIAAGVTYMIA